MYISICRCDSLAAIDLPSLLYCDLLRTQITDHMDPHQPFKLCWQLVISLSDWVGNPEDNQVIQWLRSKLSYCIPIDVNSGQNEGVERISLWSDFIKDSNPYTAKKLEMVVKLVTATHTCSSAVLYHQMQGTTAILLYVRKPNHGETMEV